MNDHLFLQQAREIDSHHPHFTEEPELQGNKTNMLMFTQLHVWQGQDLNPLQVNPGPVTLCYQVHVSLLEVKVRMHWHGYSDSQGQ